MKGTAMRLSDTYGQSIEFDIPEKYKKISVNCSGGADSSILLYMVAYYLKEKDRKDVKLNVLTCGNDFKHRWNPRKAADVINFVIDRLNWNQFDFHYAYYRDRQEEKYFHEVENELFLDSRHDLIISGINANPKVPAIVKNIHGIAVDLSIEALPERDASNTLSSWSQTGTHYTPFVNVDKRFIAAMYDYFSVQDLFKLTRSCETIPDFNLGFDSNFENTPCGECWWCLERKWAFGHF